MRSILHISCSPKGQASICGTFADQVLARLQTSHPTATVTHRDLATSPPPFVDAEFCAAIMDPTDANTAFAASETLIDELDRADAVVIATPMHNYTVPAVLKAWIDQVVRIHRSFASTPSGKIGKLADRPVFVVIASGGWFTGPSPTGTPAQPDFLTPYLRAILNTIGLTDIHFLALEGVTPGTRDAGTAPSPRVGWHWTGSCRKRSMRGSAPWQPADTKSQRRSGRDKFVPFLDHVPVLVHHRVPARHPPHPLGERPAVTHRASLLHHLALGAEDVLLRRLALDPVTPLVRRHVLLSQSPAPRCNTLAGSDKPQPSRTNTS